VIHPALPPSFRVTPPQANGWSQNKAVCDTVKCGETAKFSVRDGGSCTATLPGTWKMKDANNTHEFSCQAATHATSPCAACPGNTDFDSCLWTWTAPTTVSAALALVPPSSDKCRCTPYRPYKMRDWLCSDTSACASGLSHRRSLLAAGQCPAEYQGTQGCWLRNNWSKIMALQGLGANRSSLVLGAGDRTVSLDLPALECACTAWSLTGKTLASKTPP